MEKHHEIIAFEIISYYENGKIREIRNFKNNQQIGNTIFYNRDGTKF